MKSSGSSDKLDKTKILLKYQLESSEFLIKEYEAEKNMITSLFQEGSFGNNALLIGASKSGKTTLVNSVLDSLQTDERFNEETIIINLNGMIHTDDRLALKSITRKLKLENEVSGKVFSSFSENLSFLLSCLKKGDSYSKRLIIIMEEFDLFCGHHNQTLLYNLFDIAQSAQTPICVLGITARFDVTELLEKRVKSRFSHRQIFLLPNPDGLEEYLEAFKQYLSISKSQGKLSELDKKWINEWNSSIEILSDEPKLIRSLKFFYEFDSSLSSLKHLIFQIVTEANETTPNYISIEIVQNIIKNNFIEDDKVFLITTLSVLELCLLISIKHHSEIYDNDHFNFEMIFSRFNKFSNKSSAMKNIDREVALKAFEKLKFIEFISPTGQEGRSQKEYQLYKCHLTSEQIINGTKISSNLPIGVEQWVTNSLA